MSPFETFLCMILMALIAGVFVSFVIICRRDQSEWSAEPLKVQIPSGNPNGQPRH